MSRDEVATIHQLKVDISVALAMVPQIGGKACYFQLPVIHFAIFRLMAT